MAVVASSAGADAAIVAVHALPPADLRSRHHDSSAAAFFRSQPFHPRHHTPEAHRPDADTAGEGFKREIRDLAELFSKLNPMAEEFVPPSLVNHCRGFPAAAGGVFPNGFAVSQNGGFNASGRQTSQAKRRMNSRTSLAQHEDKIRQTVYVSDIDQQVTEEVLAALFTSCGHVVDCRICGDPNSVLRFAFIQFTNEEGARVALSLSGTVLGYYPVRVLPSKTAIAPVNRAFLPKSDDERAMCVRTIYCTNIDKKVTQAELKLFFESICGEVYRLRLLGDQHHSTRIAFVEFVMADCAISALSCSGVVLGSLPIRYPLTPFTPGLLTISPQNFERALCPLKSNRVSPSKTPVRPRVARSPMH